MLLNRPVTAIMLVIATFIFGYVALSELSVDLLPDVDNPNLMVQTEWTGASAREVETRINEQLEALLGSVPGVESSHSFARQGMGFIQLEFEWGTDMDLAFLNVREQLDRAQPRMPQQAERPQLVYANPADEPVAVIGVSQEGMTDPDFDTQLELKRWTDQVLTRRLEQQDGIAQAVMVGAVIPEVRIRYDERQADRYDLRISEIENRVQEANEFASTGELRDGWYRYSLKIESRISNLDDLRRTPLARIGGERILRLEDVAEVEMAESDPVSFSMVDGAPMLSVLVRKDYDTNLVEVYETLLPVLDSVEDQFPGIELSVLSENATYIDQTISNLLQTLLLGGVLAFFVLFFFLNDSRSPFTIGIAIPVSIFLTFFMMYLFGIQLNIISLSGLTLGIGLLVDNAIVVLENINRHRKNKSLFDASSSGTREIALAVTASTFTTISVFLPLVFLGGFEGAFFQDQALTLSISLMASLLVALAILPVLVYQFKVKATEETGSRGTIFTRLLNRVRAEYENLLEYALRKPLPFIGIFLLLIATAVTAFMYMPKSVLPDFEENSVRYRVSLPGNTALPSTEHTARVLTEQIHQNTSAEGILTMGGYTDQSNISRLMDEGMNRFSIEVPVEGPAQAERVHEIISRFGEMQEGMTARSESSLPILDNVIGQHGAPVVVHFAGMERERSAEASQALSDRLSAGGLGGLELQFPERVQTYNLYFRPDRMLRYGMSESYVINYLETSARGMNLTQWMRDDESIDVRLFSGGSSAMDPESMRIPLEGRSIPLTLVSDIVPSDEPEQYERINQTPVLSYVSDMSMADWWWSSDDFRSMINEFNREYGTEISLSGTAIQVDNLLGDMSRLLLISMILIYIILAIQYENLKYPLIIMFSVPFAWIGSLLLLWALGAGLNTLSFLGILILTGIAVNDAILKVDFMRRYYEDTGDLHRAITQAGQHRFRPVVMTTMTTVLGLLPMVMPIGEGYELRQSLGLALMGGMITSTILTLFLIPMVFNWVSKFSKPPEKLEI